MRFGTSRLGVIAVVSLLATAAAPERDDNTATEGESSIDHSNTDRITRIPSKGYSWQDEVTGETVRRIPNSFVKIEYERFGSWSPAASRSPSLPRSSSVRRVHRVAGSTETPTVALPKFTSPQALTVREQNFASIATPPDVRSASSRSPKTPLEDNNIRKVDSSDPGLVYSSTREFTKRFVVTLDSPISNNVTESSIPLPLQTLALGERKTISKSERIESRSNYEDKGSIGSLRKDSRNRRTRSNGAKSAETMNHQLTTSRTSTKWRNLPNEDFLNPTEHYQEGMKRDARDSSRNKANKGKAHFGNHEPEVNEIPRTTTRIMSEDAEKALHSDSQYLPNYSVHPGTTIHLPIQDSDDRDATEPQYSLIERSSRTLDTPKEESLVRDEAQSDHRELPVKSMDVGATRKSESVVYSSVTEEISRPRQMTSESSLDLSMIARPYSRLSGNLANTSVTVVPMSYEATSLDNHKAFEVRTIQDTRTEQREQQQESQQRAVSLESPLLPTRLQAVAISDNWSTERRPVIPVNQKVVPKTAYPVTKNHSKPSINLVDGRVNKIFYEIKPSLITEMDRGDNVEVTTTPRRIFEKFSLPSIPSGKFGPYFLDEEDRRNVTERIGNTVRLDCRIGLLGHRKVTWLQHYKDSFRLLTVEHESYSVDRRISLNFTYPDNWRLQIAYASLRDSGLYKCQVEIEQDKSLVKNYNVIITAPVLTITDDSGRPVSGERHLKAGSALKLRCEARDILQRLNESVLWMRGDETLTEDVSENKTTEIVNDKEITVVISTLFVEHATPRHAGNYSCIVPEKAKNTIAVHVLNGELPAAVQHGSGVSTAVLNVWLIHLTASYGFFR